MADVAPLLERTLLAILLPLWLVAGRLDQACHRHQRIELSSGVAESTLHLAMLAQAGIGVLVALLLEPTAAAFLVMLAAAVAHEATVWLDLRYADARRRIPWYEQWVHGLQQVLPWTALFGLALLHAGQALALFGAGGEAADWRLRARDQPLPAWYLLAFAAAALVLVIGPFAAEWLRCFKAARAAGDGDKARAGQH